jgi:hypothetical protein
MNRTKPASLHSQIGAPWVTSSYMSPARVGSIWTQKRQSATPCAPPPCTKIQPIWSANTSAQVSFIPTRARKGAIVDALPRCIKMLAWRNATIHAHRVTTLIRMQWHAFQIARQVNSGIPVQRNATKNARHPCIQTSRWEFVTRGVLRTCTL